MDYYQKLEPTMEVQAGEPVQEIESTSPVNKSETENSVVGTPITENAEAETPQVENAEAETSKTDNGEAETQKTDRSKPLKPWLRPNYQKVKKKRSVVRNFRLKKILSPKNAVASLNEIRTDIKYIVEQESTGIGHPFCISVEVDGQTFKGYGSSKQLAKQAAAEAALISFVKAPSPKGPKSEIKDNKHDDDTTPWATLASFAVYKLFNDWRGGRVGMFHPPPQQYTVDSSTQYKALSSYLNATEMTQAPSFSNITPELGSMNALKTPVERKVPKQLPENAATLHPVSLLYQMRPDIQFNQSRTIQDGKVHYVVSTVLDGVSFSGEGPNMKRAKYNMALAAVKQTFEIDSQFQFPQLGVNNCKDGNSV